LTVESAARWGRRTINGTRRVRGASGTREASQTISTRCTRARGSTQSMTNIRGGRAAGKVTRSERTSVCPYCKKDISWIIRGNFIFSRAAHCLPKHPFPPNRVRIHNFVITFTIVRRNRSRAWTCRSIVNVISWVRTPRFRDTLRGKTCPSAEIVVCLASSTVT
jgi:hypothetical protein